MLTTRTKVLLAGIAYRLISAGRRVFGKTDSVIVGRGGVRYHLNLTEGIDFSIYLLRAFERGTKRTLEKLVKPDHVVFDIGANVGAHTLSLARSAGPSGKVYAFEPSDFGFAKLRRNLALNPELEARTVARQILLSASGSDPAERLIYASWPLQSVDPVHPKHRGRLVPADHAIVDTLDDFVDRERISRLDLIKIDVDGSEFPVLKGGQKTIRRFRPILVMEISPYIHAERHHSFSDLIELLKVAGYALTDADHDEAVPLDSAELERLIPDGASINVIARCQRVPLPQESQ
jgi:FkbM family methyltransferase